MTFLIVEFLLIMQFLWRYIDDLAGKGLSVGVFLELMFYAAASIVPLALPLSILLASLMTFGNMGENYELTAIKSAGISLMRVMRPLIYIISLISIFAFFYSNISMPFFNMKMRTLLYDINGKRPEIMIKEGIFYNGIDNYSIKAGKKNSKTGMLYNLIIYNHTPNSNSSNVTVADSGNMTITADKSKLIVVLYNGYNYSDIKSFGNRDGNTYPFRRDNFKKQTFNIELTGYNLQRTDESLYKNHYQMMNMRQLNVSIDSFRIDCNVDERNFSKVLIGESYPKEMPMKNFRRNLEFKDSIKLSFLLAKDSTVAVTFNVEEKINFIQWGEPSVKNETRPIPLKPILVSDSISKIDSINQINNLKLNNEFRIWSAWDSIKLRDKRVKIHQVIETVRSAKNIVSTEASIRYSKVRRMHKHEIELHKKFTLSVACLVFFFLGAPLGAIIRKGGLGMPLVISVLFFIFYYIISLTGEKMVRESVFTPFAGMWLASYILLPIGIFITYKATHDSSLMNMEHYVKWYNKTIKKSFNYIKNKLQPVANENTDINQ